MASTPRSPESSLHFARRVWALIAPYFCSDQKWHAIGFLVAVISLNLLAVYVDVLFNQWNKAFYDTLENKNYPEFKRQMWVFTLIAFASIIVAVYRFYLTQRLEMNWRKWMTERYLARWMGPAQAYYRMELERNPAAEITDNPDQRIADDLRMFTDGTVSLSMGFLNAVVTLLSFIAILWAVSGPISFALGGQTVTIPGYMVWVAVIYAVAGSWLIHKIGKPLIGLNFKQQRFEADFRYGLIRVRENAEGAALYRGEAQERRHLGARFIGLFDNYWALIKAQKNLVWTQSFYGQVAIIFPFVVAAPRFFDGPLKLGDVMQIANAFGKVQGALSWFVDAYDRLASWKATADRLLSFEDRVQYHEASKSLIGRTSSEGSLRLSAALVTPQERPIVALDALEIKPGERVVIQGPSGSGKTTLFRALAGIWPFGSGSMAVPWQAHDVLFLPQRPYIPIGSLRAAVSYPAAADAYSDGQIKAALSDCRIAHLAERLDDEAVWDRVLSPGEQQRLSFARVLLNQPKWLFMDEATAALDAVTARELMGQIIARLPQATIISIAHNPEIVDLHQRRIVLTPSESGSTVTATPIPNP